MNTRAWCNPRMTKQRKQKKKSFKNSHYSRSNYTPSNYPILAIQRWIYLEYFDQLGRGNDIQNSTKANRKDRSINILRSWTIKRQIHPRIIAGKFGVNCASPEGDLCTSGRQREDGRKGGVAILIRIDRNTADGEREITLPTVHYKYRVRV